MFNGSQACNRPNGISCAKDWFFIPQPNPYARLRLFCFPFAGGSSVAFYHWPEFLNHTVELWALRLPGRETRFAEKPLTRIPGLISTLLPIMQPLLEKPFAFYGHSLGTRIGFELCRALRRQRLPQPVHFFVSGSRPPHLPENEPHVHLLPDLEFIEKMKEYEGIPGLILENPEVLGFFLPMLRADIELFNTYVFTEEAPLECPITAFGGLADPKVKKEEMAAWKNHTRSDFKLHMFPGGHFFIQTVQKELLAYVAEDLKSAS